MQINDIIASGLLELHVAGLTSPDEAAQVVLLAKQYPEVQAELDAIAESVEQYAMAQSVQPPAAIKQKILQQVTTGAPVVAMSATAPQRIGWKKWMAAASILLLAGVAITIILLFNKKTAGPIEEIASKKPEYKEKPVQTNYLEDHHKMEDTLRKSMTVVALHTGKKGPDGCTAVLYCDLKTGDIYIDPCRMTTAPEGKQYQVWAMVKGKPVNAGMLNINTPRDKYNIQKMKAITGATAFAITLENKGGNSKPNMEEVYVQGSVS